MVRSFDRRDLYDGEYSSSVILAAAEVDGSATEDIVSGEDFFAVDVDAATIRRGAKAEAAR